MNELIAVQKIAGWEKLKALLLDSVSSPITKRVYNMALKRVPGLVSAGATARLHQGYGKRVASFAGGLRPRFVVDHYPHVRDSRTGSRSRRQRIAGSLREDLVSEVTDDKSLA